jgi:C-terminal processing protease CtpA/Prc
MDFFINGFISDGAENSAVTLELESGGTIETVSLTREKGDTNWLYDTYMPTSVNESLREAYRSDSHRIAFTEDNIAVITIETMMNEKLPEEFYANYPLLEKARGFIIDVRNNHGGDSGNSDAVAAAFIKGNFINQRALHPIHIGVYKEWGKYQNFGDKSYEQTVAERGESDWLEKCYKIPRHMYYEDSTSTHESDGKYKTLTAPLVVLANAGTASATEDFLVELDYNKRATIVGTPSFGSTGQPLSFNLESGGGFQICTRHCIYPDGREFTNKGVKPHVCSDLTLDDYKSGFDSVMSNGLEKVRAMIQ